MLEGKRFGLQQKCHAESSDVPLRLWSQCWTHQKIQCSPLPDEQMESSISGGRVKALGFEAVATASDQHLSAPHTRCALRLLVGRAAQASKKSASGRTGRTKSKSEQQNMKPHARDRDGPRKDGHGCGAAAARKRFYRLDRKGENTSH